MTVDRSRWRTAAWLGVGTVLVAGGGSIAVLSSFNGSLIDVYAGILVFIAGYKISWYGANAVHRRAGNLVQAVRDMDAGTIRRLGRETAIVLAGGFSGAYGVFLFARTVESPSLLAAVGSGVFGFGGYMLAHEELNKALV